MIYIYVCVLYILFEILVSRCVLSVIFWSFSLCVRFFFKVSQSSIEDLLLAREKWQNYSMKKLQRRKVLTSFR